MSRPSTMSIDRVAGYAVLDMARAVHSRPRQPLSYSR
jgi:hypothetical protein